MERCIFCLVLSFQRDRNFEYIHMLRNTYTYENTGHLLIFIILNCEGLELFEFVSSLINLDLPINVISLNNRGSLSSMLLIFLQLQQQKEFRCSETIFS